MVTPMTRPTLRTACAPVALALLTACAAPGHRPRAPAGPDAITVAAIQYRIQGDRTVDQLCAAVERLARQAAAAGARLAVFPELLALDCWPLSTPADGEAVAAATIAREVTPALVDHAAALARRLDLALVVGGPRQRGGRVRNTAVLLLPDGARVLQDKLFLTAWERSMGWEAGEELLVLDAPWGRTAIAVCYDVEFPAVSQALAAHDVELLLVPSMTESEQGLCRVRACAEARAVEHHAFVVVAGTVGAPTVDWRHFGGSAVLAPQEGPFAGWLAEARGGTEALLTAPLDVAALRRSRTESAFFPVRDQQNRVRPFAVRRLP